MGSWICKDCVELNARRARGFAVRYGRSLIIHVFSVWIRLLRLRWFESSPLHRIAYVGPPQLSAGLRGCVWPETPSRVSEERVPRKLALMPYWSRSCSSALLYGALRLREQEYAPFRV